MLSKQRLTAASSMRFKGRSTTHALVSLLDLHSWATVADSFVLFSLTRLKLYSAALRSAIIDKIGAIRYHAELYSPI